MDKISKEEKIEYIKDYNKKFEEKHFNTRAIHYGQPPDFFYGSVNVPIHMSSTYAQVDCADPVFTFDYTRGGNPTRESLEHCIASLENAKYGLVASSGLSCAMLITHLFKTGDHILSVDDVYGGIGRYFRKVAVPVYGMEVDFIDMKDLEFVESSFKENTKLVWLETPTNPTLKCFDIEAIAKIAKEKGAILVVDNTFMSPYFQTPLDLGADIVLHSGTKYLGGHSDVVMGALATNDKDLQEKMHFFLGSIGPWQSPFDSYLILRSLKTLGIRMEAIGKNALTVAKFLESHEKVEKVLYPGLESHPDYEIQKKQTTGNAGIVSFYIKDGEIEQSRTFLKAIKVFTLAESLGGVESLAECPAVMTHASVPADHRELIGIKDGLIRLAVGIEDSSDLIDDLTQALEKI